MENKKKTHIMVWCTQVNGNEFITHKGTQGRSYIFAYLYTICIYIYLYMCSIYTKNFREFAMQT